MKQIVSRARKTMLAMVFVLSFASVFSLPSKSFAVVCIHCTQMAVTTGYDTFDSVGSFVDDKINQTKGLINDEFKDLRNWIIDELWEKQIVPSMQDMATQLTTGAVQQELIIGTFFDAKHQLETQTLFQELQAVAHKDYHPSVGMCKLGSGIKSLAESERRAEFNAVFLSQRSMDRQLGNANSSATYDDDLDKENRLTQFAEKFCDPKDNNDTLSALCKHDDGIGGQDFARLNKDIDYTRTVDSRWTMEVNFTDDELTDDEEEILALSSNLYAHHVFSRPGSLKGGHAGLATPLQKRYMDMRANIAKRNVAQNSFNAITSMKSEGSAQSKSFLEAILKELGVDDTGNPDQLSELLGDNPSYHAQMEVLTKKIYQSPDFYTNLYDKPANVERKGTALQAIGLMQKFDMFKSYLRSEASLSILLELAVVELQDEIENEMNR